MNQLRTPALLVNESRLEANITRMQQHCRDRHVELWPHVKTHKTAAILRRQLTAGAAGATCAKIGEAEAMLPSGVRRIFIAHSLVDPRQGERLRHLQSQLDELIVAVTSERHFQALDELLRSAGLVLPVLMAIDTGLQREGVRDNTTAGRLASLITRSRHMTLKGLYTHEGQTYQLTSPAEVESAAEKIHARLAEVREETGLDGGLWPGCSVTARYMAGKPMVHAVRPGSYVFGDLSLSEVAQVISSGDIAASILATVVDIPAPDLALVDAGSKTFSGDRTIHGVMARCVEFPSLEIRRLSEEHGFVTGPDVSRLKIGQRLSFYPAHVCPVINLSATMYLTDCRSVSASLPINARGRSD